LNPFAYVPIGNDNEKVSRFMEHNNQIEKQFTDTEGARGKLVAGIKKDIILSNRIDTLPSKVVIYGWHNPGGIPIQPVYSGHVWWYVDYSHGTRLICDEVRVDGKTCSFTEILKDPLMFKIFSDEGSPMKKAGYFQENYPE
jgi:hypothetical protein